MGELSLKNTELNQVLGSVIETIQSTDNIIDIFRNATEQLLKTIKCDYICILINNEKARYFYINHALSPSTADQSEDVIIPYSETSITEILRSHQSIIRSDLSERGQLTPGDLKFLAKGIKSDLSIPIINKNAVLAVINLSSYKNNYFKQIHASTIQQVAALLGLGLERSELIDQLRHKQADLGQWKIKFNQLIEHCSEAVALVRRDYDLIYLSNPAFQRMSGYSPEELNGMRLSQLHPEHKEIIVSKLQNEISNGQVADFVQLTMLRKDGVPLPVKFRFAGVADESFAFVFFEEAATPGQITTQKTGRGEFSLEFIQRGLAAAATDDFERLLDFIADEFGSTSGAKYISIQLFNDRTGELVPVRIKRFPDNFNFTKLKPWQIGLDQGPFDRVLKENELLVVNDIWKESDYSTWQPIARRLGYSSFVSVPVHIKNKPIGVLTSFFERRQHFSDMEQNYFAGLGAFFSFLVEKSRQSLDSYQDQLFLAALGELSELIKFDSDLTGIIKSLFVAVCKVVPFDYAQVTLFDSPAENIQTFTVVSENCRKLLPQKELARLNDSELFWMEITRMNLREQLEQNEDSNEIIENKIQSRIPYVLMAQNKYLGTIVIGHLEPNFYRDRQIQVFNQLAQHASSIIENARGVREIGSEVSDHEVQSETQGAVFSDLNMDNIIKTILNSSAVMVQADFVSFRLIKEGKPTSDLYMNQSIADVQKFQEFETKHALPMIFKNAEAYSTQLSAEPNAARQNGMVQLPLQFQAYQGFPLKVKSEIIGIVSLYWNEPKKLSPDELSSLDNFSRQAGSAIKNALDYEEAVQSADQLKIINSELEHFVYTISHDLKTPVVSIQGFSSILLNDFRHDLDASSYNYLERIQYNANKMEKMITDLLELSRVGRVVNPFEEVSMTEVVNQAVNELLFSLKDKKIKLSVDKNMPTFFCDRARMVQAFMNLVGNSIKYIGENNASPQIRIGYRDKDNADLFFVRDNGIGIDRQYHEKIFGLFQRAARELDSEDEGSGIGLAIVRKIIENHNGKIWVESQPGNGSTFYMSFPKMNI